MPEEWDYDTREDGTMMAALQLTFEQGGRAVTLSLCRSARVVSRTKYTGKPYKCTLCYKWVINSMSGICTACLCTFHGLQHTPATPDASTKSR